MPGAVARRAARRCRLRRGPARPRPRRPRRSPRRRAARAASPRTATGAHRQREPSTTSVAAAASTERDGEPAAREHRVAQQRRDRLAAPSGDRAAATAEPASQPTSAPQSAIAADSANDEKADLPAARAAREESPARARLHVGPQPRRHQHREGEQQRHGLAAEQEQAAAGDRRRVGRRASSSSVGAVSSKPKARALERRARLLDPRRQCVGRPRADRATLERHDPAVAAVRVVQHAASGRAPATPFASTSGGGAGRW